MLYSEFSVLNLLMSDSSGSGAAAPVFSIWCNVNMTTKQMLMLVDVDAPNNSCISSDKCKPSQHNNEKKCINEKQRREQETIYLEQLSEYIQETTGSKNAAFSKQDKCIVLQETISHVKNVNGVYSDDTDINLELSSSAETLLSTFTNDVVGQLLLQALNGFVIVVDVDNIVSFVSPNISEFLQFAEEELVGKRLDDVVHVDDWPRVQEAVESLRSTPSEFTARVTTRVFQCRLLVKPSDFRKKSYDSMQVLCMRHNFDGTGSSNDDGNGIENWNVVCFAIRLELDEEEAFLSSTADSGAKPIDVLVIERLTNGDCREMPVVTAGFNSKMGDDVSQDSDALDLCDDETTQDGATFRKRAAPLSLDLVSSSSLQPPPWKRDRCSSTDSKSSRDDADVRSDDVITNYERLPRQCHPVVLTSTAYRSFPITNHHTDQWKNVADIACREYRLAVELNSANELESCSDGMSTADFPSMSGTSHNFQCNSRNCWKRLLATNRCDIKLVQPCGRGTTSSADIGFKECRRAVVQGSANESESYSDVLVNEDFPLVSGTSRNFLLGDSQPEQLIAFCDNQCSSRDCWKRLLATNRCDIKLVQPCGGEDFVTSVNRRSEEQLFGEPTLQPVSSRDADSPPNNSLLYSRCSTSTDAIESQFRSTTSVSSSATMCSSSPYHVRSKSRSSAVELSRGVASRDCRHSSAVVTRSSARADVVHRTNNTTSTADACENQTNATHHRHVTPVTSSLSSERSILRHLLSAEIRGVSGRQSPNSSERAGRVKCGRLLSVDIKLSLHDVTDGNEPTSLRGRDVHGSRRAFNTISSCNPVMAHLLTMTSTRLDDNEEVTGLL